MATAADCPPLKADGSNPQGTNRLCSRLPPQAGTYLGKSHATPDWTNPYVDIIATYNTYYY